MKAVGKHFARVAEKAYARHGAVWAGLLVDWPGIIGSPLCDICVLEKISWPRHGNEPAKDQAGAARASSRHQKIGGTLVLKVAYGRALEIQHTIPQIIDRINAYYGYSAIAQIRIIQGKVEKPKISPKRILSPLDPVKAGQLDSQMSDIKDDSLKTALRHLAKGVLAEKNKQKTASDGSPQDH